MTLPLNLTESILKEIVEEVQLYSGKTISEKQIKWDMPALYQYLHQHPFSGANEVLSTLGKLQLVLQRIQKLLKSDNPLVGKVAQLLEIALQKNTQTKIDDQDVRELQLQINPYYIEPEDKAPIQAEANMEEINSHLTLFSDLLSAYRRAQKIVTHYEQSKELIVKSMVLPQAEADLLLRYQTTWERRLSTEVGEFIELQKYTQRK